MYTKETIKVSDKIEERDYPKLLHKGNHNKYFENNLYNIFLTLIIALAKSFLISIFIYLIIFRRTLFKKDNRMISALFDNKFLFLSVFSIISISLVLYDLRNN